MPTTKHHFHATTPPEANQVYLSRINTSYVHTVRYWDGEKWWDISADRGQNSKPFTWPKRARVRKPEWMTRHFSERRVALRKITKQDAIQWGEPYKHYSPAETLKSLAKQGIIAADWQNSYQKAMREENYRG